jgi:hypothetical protein
MKYTPTLGEEFILAEAGWLLSADNITWVKHGETPTENPSNLVTRSLIKELLEEDEKKICPLCLNREDNMKHCNRCGGRGIIKSKVRSSHKFFAALNQLLLDDGMNSEYVGHTFATLPQLIEAFWMAYKEPTNE